MARLLHERRVPEEGLEALLVVHIPLGGYGGLVFLHVDEDVRAGDDGVDELEGTDGVDG